ncbi:cbb3-type cytochrome c oxidase N-terminal domain-containing protein [Sulfurospirillum diekertiae]|uniref:Cytochrome c oxidase subunit III n=1 Tax=Sulfurospirillum diekertiae TaxID=1854492 RepID=A0A1Y0HNC0_9BACT|nr:cbb3-type cytochrome c oxidase N-terminal domain-containing protein [Sulfurospirillum diekertiae]ARU49627.1 Cbb3-type cytochrome c oxidase subunit CcoP [Sulfurospirillum diekertiae]ASC94428.1 Cbb3-type cytochrome c oxidase subunit CcoP [Sulfurospirillum diekertiae]
MNWLNDNVNVLSLLGAAAILILTIFVVGKYIRQMKTDKSSGELAKENWDGIGEYKNVPPIGWALSFVGVIVWGLWYFLAGYPLASYSQIGEYNEEVKSYNTHFESKFANPDNATLMGMGEGVFLVQCAPCHGVTGDGMNGKAMNLTKFGNEAAIVATILGGAKGSNYPLGEMPAGLLDAESAKAVAAYVMQEVSVVKKSSNPALVESGKALWATCAACHGDDGKGMAGSAPDLSVYGSAKFVVNVLGLGKKGTIGNMPQFNDGRLTNVQKTAVGTYVSSLAK